METTALLKQQYDAIRARKAEIDAAAAPLAARREALWEKVHPLRGEIDALAAEERALKGGDYHLLCQQLGRLARALGGKGLG